MCKGFVTSCWYVFRKRINRTSATVEFETCVAKVDTTTWHPPLHEIKHWWLNDSMVKNGKSIRYQEFNFSLCASDTARLEIAEHACDAINGFDE